MNFKEIFIQPKERILEGLKNKEQEFMPAISVPFIIKLIGRGFIRISHRYL